MDVPRLACFVRRSVAARTASTIASRVTSLPLREPLPRIVGLIRTRGDVEQLLECLVLVVRLPVAAQGDRLAEEAHALAALLVALVEVTLHERLRRGGLSVDAPELEPLRDP